LDHVSQSDSMRLKYHQLEDVTCSATVSPSDLRNVQVKVRYLRAEHHATLMYKWVTIRMCRDSNCIPEFRVTQ